MTKKDSPHDSQVSQVRQSKPGEPCSALPGDGVILQSGVKGKPPLHEAHEVTQIGQKVIVQVLKQEKE